MQFEFHLRLEEDIHVVGEAEIEPKIFSTDLVGNFCPPALGSLVYMEGVRFSVSDMVTSIKCVRRKDQPLQHEYEVKVECSATFTSDKKFMAALKKLANADVLFEADVLDMLLEDAE